MSTTIDFHVLTDSIKASVIRVSVPVIVGLVLGALAKANLHIGSDLVVQGVTAAVTLGYYTAVRLLETKVAPHFGWLLGLAKAPAYSASTTTVDVDER